MDEDVDTASVLLPLWDPWRVLWELFGTPVGVWRRFGDSTQEPPDLDSEIKVDFE